jgi:hypothetical protein
MIFRGRSLALMGAVSGALLLVSAGSATAGTNRSDACNSHYCGSATFANWSSTSVDVTGLSIADMQRGDGLANGSVLYYKSDCSKARGEIFKAPQDGSGTYGAFRPGVRTQANLVGVRFFADASGTNGGLKGDWVDNPSNSNNVVC